MKNSIILLFILFSVGVFGQVPNTTTFTLQNVVDEVNPTTDDLSDCFNDAVASYFNPAYEGSKNSLLNFRDYGPHNIGSHVIYFYTTGTGTWTIPTGVTSIQVEIWGSGGAGGKGGTGTQGGGGGGGAYYLLATKSVTAGQTCTYEVGIGGTATAGNGNNGTRTIFTFPNTDVMLCAGGEGGKSYANGGAGGAGGGFSINFFDYTIFQSLGNGASGTASLSGGGSGGAGSTSNGNTASGATGAASVYEYGGAGGNGSTSSNTSGTNGGNYGGGGGGATGTGTAGSGANGLLRITY